MPKKTKFTKEAVIEAGMSQIKDNGWEGLTPKSVAKRLGASTMPIFSHFPTMAALREAILDRAWENLIEYTSRSYTGDVWVDQGVGYVLFARDHGRIFSCMHYGPPAEVQDRRYRFGASISDKLEDHPSFEGMNAKLVGQIRHLRALLTHGMAVAVSSGLTSLWDNEELVKQMMSLCSEVLCEGLSKREDKIDQILR